MLHVTLIESPESAAGKPVQVIGAVLVETVSKDFEALNAPAHLVRRWQSVWALLKSSAWTDVVRAMGCAPVIRVHLALESNYVGVAPCIASHACAAAFAEADRLFKAAIGKDESDASSDASSDDDDDDDGLPGAREDNSEETREFAATLLQWVENEKEEHRIHASDVVVANIVVIVSGM